MTAVDERSKAAEIEAAECALTQAEQSFGQDNVQIYAALRQLAALYHRDGLYARAGLLYQRAVVILTESGPKEQLVQGLLMLGMLYRTENKLDDAESVYLRALATVEPADDNASLRAELLCCLAGLYLEKHQPAQAQELLKKAIAAYQTAFGQNSSYCRLCCMALAAVLKRQGKSAEADEYCQRSCKDISTVEGDVQGDERALLELVQNYYLQGRLDETDQLLAESIYTDDARLWPDHRRVAQAFENRGELFRAQGNFADAEFCFKRALDMRQRILGPCHPQVAESAMSLATMYLAQNRCGDAEPVLKIALKTRVQAFGVGNPAVAACIETYAAMLKRTKRGAIAARLEACARDIRDRLVGKADRAAASDGTASTP